MSSIDMKTVMTLRRKRKTATPSVNRIALRIRYQASGTLCGKGISGMLVDLLAGEHDGSDDRDEDQNAGDFKRQQVGLEKAAADFLRIAVRHGAELHAFGDGQHALDHKGGDTDERGEQREAGVSHPEASREFALRSGVEEH